LNKNIWEKLFEKHKELIDGFLAEKEISPLLPWSCIHSGVSEKFYVQEMERSCNGELTSQCIKKCNNCGICKNSSKIVQNSIQLKESSDSEKLEIPITSKTDPDTYRIIFSFSKQGNGVFHPHLGLLEIFSMAFLRAGIPVIYTQGFNPLPKLEIASPLSLGIKAGAEIASIETDGYFDAEQFKKSINEFFPEGLQIVEAMNVFIPSGGKKYSLSSLLWGYVYAGKDNEKEIVGVKEEKSYRELRIGPAGSIYSLERLSLLASLNGVKDESIGVSYFEVYRALYPETGKTGNQSKLNRPGQGG
jgi:radical SAM-linked protein